MEKHRIDRLFEERLKNYAATPADSSWQAIEKSLNSGRRSWSWLWIAASALVVLTSGYLLYSSVSMEDEGTQQPLTVLNPQVELPVHYELPVFVGVTNTQKQNILAPDKVLVANFNPVSPPSLGATDVVDSAPLVQNNPIARVKGRFQSIKEASLMPVLKENEIPADPLSSSEQAGEELVTASTRGLTIIYKQGDKKEKNKFTQALDFIDEVRKGEKKLINFKSIKANIKARREAVKNSK